MRAPVKLRHEFVEVIPRERENGVLYVSIPFATAVHNCFCGCGTKVVTPISPVGWQLIFDGEAVSLSPSVGNWAYPCRSHYYIRRDTVVWAGDMTEEEIAWGRARDKSAREAHFDGNHHTGAAPAATAEAPPSKRRGFWSWLLGRG